MLTRPGHGRSTATAAPAPPPPGTTTVADGNGHPVASYGFEEAAGTVAVDQFGGNDGAITGATRVDNGRFGRALSLRGRRRHRRASPTTPSLHLGAGMTLEAWVKPTATTDWRTT